MAYLVHTERDCGVPYKTFSQPPTNEFVGLPLT